ncbi:MAG: YbhB/YbcL family Raf kinase inhibitor-like protein [Planctomycetes bacterium]|nr:YbhB/YbcL family Raf kinase inhibitor-like protein [Planctomycetota bacterium]
MAPLVVESDAFKNGQPLPRRHTGDGEDLSPALRWSGAPAGTREFALTCDDPDAPGADPWAHWVVYKLPATLSALPEGVARDQSLPALGGALQGRNSWPSNNIGYRGPQPPAGSGAHHYRFRVYALSAPLDLPAGATRAALAKAMKGKVLAEGEVVGTYERRGTKG